MKPTATYQATTTVEKALTEARRLAKDGPRVAAVLWDTADPLTGFGAVPGFVDNALIAHRANVVGEWRQVFLVTPDGSVWIPADAPDAHRQRNQTPHCAFCQSDEHWTYEHQTRSDLNPRGLL